MLRPPRGCSTLGVDERMRVPWPAARTTTAATVAPPAASGTDVSCAITNLLGRLLTLLTEHSVVALRRSGPSALCWGTRTRTETARLQRPAGCRLPHPPPAAGGPPRGRRADGHPTGSLGPGRAEGTRRAPVGTPAARVPAVRPGSNPRTGSGGRPPYAAVGYGHVTWGRGVQQSASTRATFLPRRHLVRSCPHPAHGSPAHRGSERRVARQCPRQREGHTGAAHALRVRHRAVPGPGRGRPRRLGLGAVVDRCDPLRRLLLPDAAGRHRRLPPALHPWLVQGEHGAARRAGRRRRHGHPGPRRPVGRRPPSAPRVRRPSGRPALALALRLRRQEPRQGHVPRPPRLAVRPPA